MGPLKSFQSVCVMLVYGLLLAAGCASYNRSPDDESDHPIASSSPPTDAGSSGAGWVIVEFEVDAEGTTRNIQIVESHPPGKFDSAMIEAVAKWRYKPAMSEGKAVPSKQRVKYAFGKTSNLTKSPEELWPIPPVPEDLWPIESTQPALPLPEVPKD